MKNQLDTILKEENKAARLTTAYIASLNECSRKGYLWGLNVVAHKLGMTDAYAVDWSQFRNEHATAIRAWLVERYSASTAHKILAAVSGVLSKAVDLELLSGEDYLRTVRACRVRLNDRPRPATGRMLTQEEVGALLATCEYGPPNRGLRDKAIISILNQTGARRAEIAKISIEDYEPDFTTSKTGEPVARLLLHGKGHKDRYVYLKGSTRITINQWVEFRGKRPGGLFPPIYKSDEPLDDETKPLKHMQINSIGVMLVERGEMAKLPHFTTHDLRRTFTSEALARGVDVLTVGAILGHTDPKVTAGYDRRNETRKIDAIEDI